MEGRANVANVANQIVADANPQPVAKVRMTAKEFAAKCKDKREIYHMLSHENGVYLSAYDTMTVWHMRDLASGTCQRIKGTDVCHLHVPQYEHLTVEHFLDFARRFPQVMMCLPVVEKEVKALPRQYIINIMYTVLGGQFSDWVDERVNARHDGVAEEGEMYIELDPEVAEIFRNSRAVSTNQGNSYNLMKAGAKRRRSKQQILDDKRQKEEEKAAAAQAVADNAEMRQQLAEL
jgi:hypothetical protein